MKITLEFRCDKEISRVFITRVAVNHGWSIVIETVASFELYDLQRVCGKIYANFLSRFYVARAKSGIDDSSILAGVFGKTIHSTLFDWNFCLIVVIAVVPLESKHQPWILDGMTSFVQRSLFVLFRGDIRSELIDRNRSQFLFIRFVVSAQRPFQAIAILVNYRRKLHLFAAANQLLWTETIVMRLPSFGCHSVVNGC